VRGERWLDAVSQGEERGEQGKEHGPNAGELQGAACSEQRGTKEGQLGAGERAQQGGREERRAAPGR
jgi:hypothetical protein